MALAIHHLNGLRVESAAMRLMVKIALVLTLVACKAPDATPVQPAGGSGGSGVGRAVTSATPAAARKPWQVPVAAKPVSGDADATALGTAITAHLIERVTNLKEGGWRHVKTVLVLEGNGIALAADETDEGAAQDGSQATLALAGEADIVLPPLTPPRSFTDKDLPNDAMPALDFKGPLLFVVNFASKGEKRVLAVAHDHDTIVVWTMIAASDSVDVAPSWSATGTLNLAPGAKLNAPALVAATAAAPPAWTHAGGDRAR